MFKCTPNDMNTLEEGHLFNLVLAVHRDSDSFPICTSGVYPPPVDRTYLYMYFLKR